MGTYPSRSFGLGAKTGRGVRANSFDASTEAALRRAGGARVVLSDADAPFDAPTPPAPLPPASRTSDADAFLQFSGAGEWRSAG